MTCFDAQGLVAGMRLRKGVTHATLLPENFKVNKVLFNNVIGSFNTISLFQSLSSYLNICDLIFALSIYYHRPNHTGRFTIFTYAFLLLLLELKAILK